MAKNTINPLNQEILMLLDNAMEASQPANLYQSVEQLMKLMADSIQNQEFENLYFLFQSGAKRIEAWGNRLNIDANENYRKVFFFAAFWTSKKISGKLYDNYLKECDFQKKYEDIKALLNYKNIVPMLELLEMNGELPQGSIAEHLSMSSQALSNFLRRYEKYGLWSHERYGRLNLYRITNDGKNYLLFIQKKKLQDSCSINDILIFFLNCFTDELCKTSPDMENIIHEMNQKFGKSQPIFGNEADKLAIRKSMRKIHHGIKRKQRPKKYFRDDYLSPIIDLDDKSFRFIEPYDLEERVGGEL